MANYYSTVSVRPGPNIDSGAVSERRIINVSVYANTPVYCYVNLNTGGRPATRIGRVNNNSLFATESGKDSNSGLTFDEYIYICQFAKCSDR